MQTIDHMICGLSHRDVLRAANYSLQFSLLLAGVQKLYKDCCA
jgi:hypothetical protein